MVFSTFSVSNIAFKVFKMGFKLRKFAYKHPTFGRTKVAKSQHPYKHSVYYFWWEFLGRNDAYRKCCESNGKGKLKNLYADFGDIFNSDFKTWWNTENRGVNLFAEELVPEFKVIDEMSEFVPNNTLLIQLPLQLPKRYLSNQFQKILRNHHSGRKGIRTNKSSTAKYPITGHVDISSLEKCLRVYDYKLANPNKSLWEIGNDCKVVLQSKLIKDPKTDLNFYAKKMVLANTTKRLLNKAKLIINGTSKGMFPILK
jgi:hypothetical protein